MPSGRSADIVHPTLKSPAMLSPALAALHSALNTLSIAAAVIGVVAVMALLLWLWRRGSGGGRALRESTDDASAGGDSDFTPAADQPEQALATTALLADPTAPALVADLLVVDDSAVARAKLRRLFETAGYQVQLARDGVEALALLHKGRYRLMITDLEMPNLDGVALIGTCQSQPHTAGMPILAITGHEDLQARLNECQEICGIYRKPWIDEDLASHVALLVGKRNVHQAEGVEH
jgi:CheY-like chemotaxis protein